MMMTFLPYVFAITMLVVCVAVIYFLREKRWAMMRDALNEYARNREKDARDRASEKLRSHRSKGDRNVWGTTVSPISAILGLEVSTELRTRR